MVLNSVCKRVNRAGSSGGPARRFAQQGAERVRAGRSLKLVLRHDVCVRVRDEDEKRRLVSRTPTMRFQGSVGIPALGRCVDAFLSAVNVNDEVRDFFACKVVDAQKVVAM
jgi:hypothetical protein